MAPLISGSEPTAQVWTNAGAPVNGTTLANVANIGDLLVDTTNKELYCNTNTKASPTWTKYPQSGEIVVGDMANASLNAIPMAYVGNANVTGGIPLLFRVDVADAASGNVEVTMTHKIRVLDAWVVKTAGAGHADNKYTVGNGANAITNDIGDADWTDKDLVRATTIDDANHEIAGAGALRVTWVKAGGNVAATVYVLAIRVA